MSGPMALEEAAEAVAEVADAVTPEGDGAPVATAPGDPDGGPVPARASGTAKGHRSREEVQREVIEVIAAIVLGLAAVFTAWSAYQAVIHSGTALEAFSDSALTSVEAQQQLGSGDMLWTEDLIVFLDWEKAVRAGDTEYADHLKGLMTWRLVEAIDWWKAQPEPRPPSPFVEGSPIWTNYFYDRGEALQSQAHETFRKAQAASATSDRFTLSTVLYALVLFIAGIALALRRTRIAAVLLGISLVVLTGATAHLVVTQLAI
jgi:hypothetical protein